jgi:transcriptional regulator with XRE-family HTH domain
VSRRQVHIVIDLCHEVDYSEINPARFWTAQLWGSMPVGELDIRIGTLVGDARQAAGLPQGEVARRLGVSQSRVARWELGERRLSFGDALALAQLYGVSVASFDPGESCATLPAASRRRHRTPSMPVEAPPIEPSSATGWGQPVRHL